MTQVATPSALPASDPSLSPLSAAMLTLGDQWNLLILQHAFVSHARRFSEWRDILGISESVLTDRLRELVAADVFTTSAYRDSDRQRQRQEYRLTERGLALWPLLVAIWAWETRWVDGRGRWPPMRHVDCGAHPLPLLGCHHCGAFPISARDTETLDESRGRITRGSRHRHHRKSSRAPDQTGQIAYHPETLDILGDRWSTLILGLAFLRVRTFAEFKARLQIAPSILAARLRRFVEHGIFAVASQAGRRGHDYKLTEKGLAFFPVFAFLCDWSNTWLSDDTNLPDLIIRHPACDSPFSPMLVCDACHQPLNRRSIYFESAT